MVVWVEAPAHQVEVGEEEVGEEFETAWGGGKAVRNPERDREPDHKSLAEKSIINNRSEQLEHRGWFGAYQSNWGGVTSIQGRLRETRRLVSVQQVGCR